MDHQPVLLEETIEYWRGKPGGFYVDATLGSGRHTEALLERDPSARCLGIDRDLQAIQLARAQLKRFGDRIQFYHGNYEEVPKALREGGYPLVNGLLADLGVSSMQLDRPERGFSFRTKGPIDMRMGQSGATAMDYLKTCSESELGQIIFKWGEDPHARKIAAALKAALKEGRLTDTMAMADVVSEAAGPAARKHKIHPATRTFQALRMAVNREEDHLQNLLSFLPSIMSEGGKAVIISFHSLEDRRVKSAFAGWAKGCVCPPSFPACVCGKKPGFRVLTKKAVVPTAEEVGRNPRSRSAKLRAAEKI